MESQVDGTWAGYHKLTDPVHPANMLNMNCLACVMWFGDMMQQAITL